MIHRIQLLLSVGFICLQISGQHYIPLHKETVWQIEKQLIKLDVPFHLSYSPFHSQNITPYFQPDSLWLNHLDTSSSRSWIYRKLRTEHLASVKANNVMLSFDILFDLRLGTENETGRTIFRNTRAGQIEGQLGKKITFYSKFYENQAAFPTYIDSFIRKYWIVPGQGVKRDFGKSGFDFNWAEGGFLWSPLASFQLEVGQGKKFIGNGYRSLLLSDNAFSYPHIALIYSNNTLKYVKSFASLMHNIHNVNRGNYLFDRKFFTSHYLNFNFLKGDLQIALFEGNIWANPDSTGQFNYKPIYLNPVPLITSFTKNNNSVIGLNIAFNIFNTAQLYGQWLVDDHIGEDQNYTESNGGFQLGSKYFDALGIPGLFMLAEYNQIAPYTFAHSNNLVSYSHYNQPLAHPVGANFREGIFKLNYQRKSILFKTQFNIIRYGDDTQDIFWGRNIFHSPESSNKTESHLLQGIETDIQYFSVELSYILNPLTNMNLSLGYHSRNFTNNHHSSVYSTIFAAFRTSLNNFYYDF